MFELSVALKYLIPRWRQLSVSIISIISILVITLVVWLIIVFLSVTNGLEKSWIQKLIALTAPVRITPTDAYYNSHYYQIDSISEKSNYSHRSIAEKLATKQTDPYDPNSDEEVPLFWSKPVLNGDGTLKDLVKEAYASIEKIPGVMPHDYELTVGNLRLRLVRDLSLADTLAPHADALQSQGFMSQAAYLGSFDPYNASMLSAAQPVSMADLSNILKMMSVTSDNIQEDSPASINHFDSKTVQQKLHTFFNAVEISSLKTPVQGWLLPKSLYPEKATWRGIALMQRERLLRLIIPQDVKNLDDLQKKLDGEGYTVVPADVKITKKEISVVLDGPKTQRMSGQTPLLIAGNVSFPAKLEESSIDKANAARDLNFEVTLNIQGNSLNGSIPFNDLDIAQATIKQTSTTPLFWLYRDELPNKQVKLNLPSDPHLGEGVLLPKPFKESGVLLGDRGFLSYMTPTTSTIQEQRIPIFVAGFYDPGIIPIGGKFVLANRDVTNLIRTSHNQEDTTLSNGINVRFANIEDADKIKEQLEKNFKDAGISKYWKIETFREFDFTKDLLQQLRSDKYLFTLIAVVIIIVACSNIISMLIILVNDKKVEIGILRSMGASSTSIATIFGLCGFVMGIIGSLLGTFAALFTLKNLQTLVILLSKMQGHDAFNPVFFGDTLPNEISFEALSFVLGATALISILAGIVPAVKASLLRPSAILRSE